jgi:O-antigen/teichoic acid export membrane protein
MSRNPILSISLRVKNNLPIRLVTDATYYILLTFALKLVSGATGFIFPKILGSSNWGAFSVITALVTVSAALGHLSIAQAQIGIWSQFRDKALFFSNAIILSLCTGAVTISITYGITKMGFIHSLASDPQSLIWIALMSIPVIHMSLALTELAKLNGKIGVISLSYLVTIVLYVGYSIFILLFHKVSVYSVVILWVLQGAVGLIVLLFGLGFKIYSLSIKFCKRLLSSGARLHFSVVSIRMLLRIDVIILAILLPNNQIGQYSLAVSIAELVLVVPQGLNAITKARQASTDIRQSIKLTILLIRTNILVSAFVSGIGMLVASFILPLVYSKEFSESVTAMWILLPAVIAWSALQGVIGMIVRIEKYLLLSLASALALVLNIALNFILVPKIGIFGASLSSSICYSILAAILIGKLVRTSRSSYISIIPRLTDLRDLFKLIQAKDLQTGRAETKVTDEVGDNEATFPRF